MFALRDFGAGSKDAVLALAEGFGDASALFRYVHFTRSSFTDYHTVTVIGPRHRSEFS